MAIATLWPLADEATPLPSGTLPQHVIPAAPSPTGTDLVIVRMGEVTMQIPKDYFRALPDREGRAPDGIGFTLLILLPNFEPRTPENSTEFDRLGWHHQMLLAVHYKGYSKSGGDLLHTMRSFAKGAHIESGPFGYSFFVNLGFEYLFKGTIAHPTFVVGCSPSQEKSRPDGHYWPYCQRILPIATDIYVSYSYSRTYLAEAPELDRQVVTFLNKFRVSGRPFEALQ